MGQTLATTGSLTGESSAARLSWAQNLDFEPRRGGQHEILYFVGCVSSLYPQAFGLPQSMVNLLEMEDEDYAVLGGDEVCCGYPLYIGGFVDEARAMAETNLRSVREAGASRLLTTCPSCYRAWHEFYPDLLGYKPDVEVIHATQWLAETDLELKPLERTVTYQDPCDLGRASGIYDEPREFLARIDGLEFVELPFNRAEGLCCGGGGNMESMDLDASRAVVQLRMKQAAGTGAGIVVTACPQCKRTLASGRSREARLKVMDIVELAWRQVRDQ
jgi:Fe-S oxidoreductase